MILANPRSRTKWLSEYLLCGHDMALGCGSVHEFGAKLRDVHGTVETSVAVGWRLWQKLFPNVRFAIVHRTPFEIAESFARLGLAPDWMFIYQQDRALWQFAESAPARMFTFEGLSSAAVRAELCSWIDVPFEAEHDRRLADEKIEVDAVERRLVAESNRGRFVAFNDDLAQRLVMLEYAPQ